MDDIKQRLLWCTADLPLYEMPNGEWVPDENAVHDLAAAALARIEELERERDTARCAANLFAAYLCGRNKCHIRVALAGNPDVCDSLINKAADWMDSNPIDDEKSIESIA